MATGRSLLLLTLATCFAVSLGAQRAAPSPDWKAVEDETLRHYQSLIRFDTSASERPATEYIKQLRAEGNCILGGPGGYIVLPTECG